MFYTELPGIKREDGCCFPSTFQILPIPCVAQPSPELHREGDSGKYSSQINQFENKMILPKWLHEFHFIIICYSIYLWLNTFLK